MVRGGWCRIGDEVEVRDGFGRWWSARVYDIDATQVSVKRNLGGNVPSITSVDMIVTATDASLTTESYAWKFVTPAGLHPDCDHHYNDPDGLNMVIAMTAQEHGGSPYHHGMNVATPGVAMAVPPPSVTRTNWGLRLAATGRSTTAPSSLITHASHDNDDDDHDESPLTTQQNDGDEEDDENQDDSKYGDRSSSSTTMNHLPSSLLFSSSTSSSSSSTLLPSFLTLSSTSLQPTTRWIDDDDD
jgi:hypothetical protein